MVTINPTTRTQTIVQNQTDETSGAAGKAGAKGPGSGVNGGGGQVPDTGGQGGGQVSGQRMGLLGQAPPDNSAADARLQGALEKLNDPNASVAEKLEALIGILRDPDMLGKLMIEFATMGRQNALDARLASREQARSDLEAQAGETREAAAKQLAGAIVALVIAVVSLVVTSVMTSKSLSENKKGFDDSQMAAQDKKLGNAIGDSQKGRNLNIKGDELGASSTMHANKAQALNALMPAITQLVGALGQAVNASLDYSAKMDEARGQELAANSQINQSDADIAKKFMDDLEEMIKTALQFVRELQNAEVELMKNMTF